MLLGGCGPTRPARVVPPTFSPAAVTKCVFDLADRDRNGECSRDELTVVPGLNLKEALEEIDRDKNGRLSEQELFGWLEGLQGSKVAVFPCPVCILLNGKPLPGVRVQIVPDPCMGNNVKAAEGITDEAGMASLRIPSVPFGAHGGIYRLQITGKDTAGQPIASKYNTQTSLGLIVPIVGRMLRFDLE